MGYLPGCELSTNEAVKQAVQAGLGLGVVSAQTIELELETGRLVALPVKTFPIVRQWFVVHRRDKRLSAASQAFRELLLARLRAPSAPRRVPDELRTAIRWLIVGRSSRGSRVVSAAAHDQAAVDDVERAARRREVAAAMAEILPRASILTLAQETRRTNATA